MRGALLVAGTHSDVGKTAITAGLCRWLAREGVRVAPFKAQNMALNSMVTAGGAEIGRAQAMQAAAARVAPTSLMNPVLLKPASDQRSQVIVLGKPWRDADARTYQQLKLELLDVVLDSLATLRASYDVVICEGAGNPAEVNLRAGDITNMGLARAADLPVLIVGDIDRGGVFASLLGTLAVLDPADQRHIAGYVINKFRGDRSILKPGLDWLSELTGRPCAGVLPWLPGAWPDGEDSMRLDQSQPWTGRDAAGQALRVAVIHFPRLSNYTDVDPLACEPGVLVRLAKQPDDIADADLVILPGTRATVHDLQWLRDRGLAQAVCRRATQGLPVIGICGGYQMLGSRITDGVENKIAEVPGLGLLPVTTQFTRSKTLRQSSGSRPGSSIRACRTENAWPAQQHCPYPRQSARVHHGTSRPLPSLPSLREHASPRNTPNAPRTERPDRGPQPQPAATSESLRKHRPCHWLQASPCARLRRWNPGIPCTSA